jgi:hypothetical protein
MPLNPVQALKVIEDFKAKPDELVKVANTIALEVPAWVLELNRRIGATNARIDALTGKAPAAPSAEPVFDTGTQVPPHLHKQGGQRMNADGSPMSAEDMAIEDVMDTAADGMPANPNAPSPAPAAPVAPVGVPVDVLPAVVGKSAAAAVKPVTPKPKMASVPQSAPSAAPNANGGATASDAKA